MSELMARCACGYLHPLPLPADTSAPPQPRATTSAPAATQADVDRVTMELDSQVERNNTMADDLSAAKVEIATLKEEVNALRTELSNANEQASLFKQELDGSPVRHYRSGKLEAEVSALAEENGRLSRLLAHKDKLLSLAQSDPDMHNHQRSGARSQSITEDREQTIAALRQQINELVSAPCTRKDHHVLEAQVTVLKSEADDNIRNRHHHSVVVKELLRHLESFQRRIDLGEVTLSASAATDIRVVGQLAQGLDGGNGAPSLPAQHQQQSHQHSAAHTPRSDDLCLPPSAMQEDDRQNTGVFSASYDHHRSSSRGAAIPTTLIHFGTPNHQPRDAPVDHARPMTPQRRDTHRDPSPHRQYHVNQRYALNPPHRSANKTRLEAAERELANTKALLCEVKGRNAQLTRELSSTRRSTRSRY